MKVGIFVGYRKEIDNHKKDMKIWIPLYLSNTQNFQNKIIHISSNNYCLPHNYKLAFVLNPG